MKIFFDCEFTGLHQNTTLISIGCVDEDGRTFYGELTDYDKSQVNDWIRDNVIVNLSLELLGKPNTPAVWPPNYYCGDSDKIRQELLDWFAVYDHVEMWGDVLTYDWMLFRELFNNKLPENVFYIPVDLSTILTIRRDFDSSFHPDMSREKLAGISDSSQKHNALWDALVIRTCYDQLTR